MVKCLIVGSYVLVLHMCSAACMAWHVWMALFYELMQLLCLASACLDHCMWVLFYWCAVSCTSVLSAGYATVVWLSAVLSLCAGSWHCLAVWFAPVNGCWKPWEQLCFVAVGACVWCCPDSVPVVWYIKFADYVACTGWRKSHSVLCLCMLDALAVVSLLSCIAFAGAG